MVRQAGAGATLLDVNVLVALFHPEHVHHEIAHDWFADHRGEGWATCPITENGFLRVVLQLSAADPKMRPAHVAERLRTFCRSSHHHFWGDIVSLQDESLFKLAFASGSRQLTDIYLLGLAKKMGGRLATFDRTIPLKSVVGATPALVEMVGPAA